MERLKDTLKHPRLLYGIRILMLLLLLLLLLQLLLLLLLLLKLHEDIVRRILLGTVRLLDIELWLEQLMLWLWLWLEKLFLRCDL